MNYFPNQKCRLGYHHNQQTNVYYHTVKEKKIIENILVYKSNNFTNQIFKKCKPAWEKVERFQFPIIIICIKSFCIIKYYSFHLL